MISVDLDRRDEPGAEEQPSSFGTLRDILHTSRRHWHPWEAPDPKKEWPVEGSVFNALDLPKPLGDIVQIPGYRYVLSHLSGEASNSSVCRALANHGTVMEWYRYDTNTHHGLQPLSDLSWSIASSKHATSRFHIDTAGLATGSIILTGKKYWVVARDPLFGQPDSNGEGRFRRAHAERASLHIGDEERFEGMLLSEGTVL